MPGYGLWALGHVLLASAGFQGRQLTPQVAPYVSVNAPVVALTHVRLVDGTGAAAREDQTVIVTGSRITATGPTVSTVAPSGAQLIDLTGHTVIPGLVQLHEHTWLGHDADQITAGEDTHRHALAVNDDDAPSFGLT